MCVYGYVRVSSKEQNEDRQLIAMLEAGIQREKIIVEKQSGKDFKRPKYQALVKKVAGKRCAGHQKHRPFGQKL